MKRQSITVDADTRSALISHGPRIDEERTDHVSSLYSADDWLRENQTAIAAYNRRVHKHGIWNQGSRPW